MWRLLVLLTALLITTACAKIYMHEPFDSDTEWIARDAYRFGTYGKLNLSSGNFYGDKVINQGYKTTEDAHFYLASRPIGEAVNNEGKDLVVSFSVKHEQDLDCGGGYIKLFPDMDPKKLHGETVYSLMFGPDKCGYTNKVYITFNYKGENLLWKKEPRYPDDKLTHVYTVVVHPDNTYEFYLDQMLKESGKLEDDWKFLKPKEIDDPSDQKPSDWVDDAQMDDPTDSKPADWDSEPEQIADPTAQRPDAWDSEEDGVWEAPTIPNPKFKGEWHPKRIPNPAYKGLWRPKQVPNPAYQPDDNLYLMKKPLAFVGIDIWQVKSGSIFDNIIVGDNLTEVNAIIDKTWKATKDAEKAELDAMEGTAVSAAVCGVVCGVLIVIIAFILNRCGRTGSKEEFRRLKELEVPGALPDRASSDDGLHSGLPSVAKLEDVV